MPTTEEIRERLARFMGWSRGKFCYMKDSRGFMHFHNWQPDLDRNQIAMVEERLNVPQRKAYCTKLLQPVRNNEFTLKEVCFIIRTAPPLQCAQALYEVIGE